MGDYIAQITQERDSLYEQGGFPHAVRLLEKELRPFNESAAQISDKVFIPVDKYPEYNFIGRILGPKGMYLKRLENENNCRIYIRGTGSLRDKAKEERLKSQPGQEHLSEPLHVVINVQPGDPMGPEFLRRARAEIERLLVPMDEKEDRIKWEQLTELKMIRENERGPIAPFPSESRYGPDRSYGPPARGGYSPERSFARRGAGPRGGARGGFSGGSRGFSGGFSAERSGFSGPYTSDGFDGYDPTSLMEAPYEPRSYPAPSSQWQRPY